MEPVLADRDVRRVHQMREVRVEALRGVSVDIFVGPLLVLLGPSGSAKSTLLNVLGGLDLPTDGRLFYHQQDLSPADDDVLTDYRRAHVGFVFQFDNLAPTLTAVLTLGDGRVVSDGQNERRSVPEELHW